MDICNQCNIVYDEKKCPLCEAKEKIEALEEQVINAVIKMIKSDKFPIENIKVM